MSANVSVPVSVCASLHRNVWEHPFRITRVAWICDAAANLDVYIVYRYSHCFIAPDVQTRLLSVLPNELKAGNPLGYCVLHLVGILTQTAAAELICQLSRDCKLDALQPWVSNSASSTNSPRG